MITIYKYPIQPSAEEIVLDIPGGGPVLSAGIDPMGDICVWAVANTDEKSMPVNIYCVGTGWPFDWIMEKEDEIDLVGTVKDGVYIWHIFRGVKR